MESDIVIARPDEEEISHEYAPVVARAAALEVANKEQHGCALLCLRDLATAKKVVNERLDPVIKHAHQAHRGLTSIRSDLLKPLEAASRIVSGKLDTYEKEQKRIADEARRAAEAAARKLEEERRLNEAIDAELAGDSEAETLLDEPIEVPAVSVQPQVAKVQGVSARTIYKAIVVDPAALVAYVAKNPAWLHLVEPNESALNGLARSQREALSIPGVKVITETSRSVRTA